MIQEFRNRPREEAGEKIEHYILQNQLKPHDKLPSERDLCEMWGFNRTTLRSALLRLIQDGKLYNKRGSGTFVAPLKLNRNLQDLKSFSATVEETGRGLATDVLSKRVIESNKQIAKQLCIVLGHRVLELIRMRKIDGEPVMIETTYLDYERYQGLEQHDFSKESLYNVMEQNYGTSISNGTQKLSITYAEAHEAELLKVEEGRPLYYLTGLVKDEENIPVEYFKTVARVDKIRFSSTLTR